MLRRLALAASWRGDDAARVRSIVLAIAAAVVTLVASVAVSAVLMANRVNDRAAVRALRPALETETADLTRDAIFDSIRGEPVLIYLWRIETDGVVIPGLPADASTGTWFVSPELKRRISSEPELAQRFPAAVEITPDGVGAADELVAYRLVGDGVELRERLVNQPGDEWIGLDAGIGGGTVGLGAAGLILVIGIGFLGAALGPLGVGLDRRLSLLHALGASRSALRSLTALTTAVAVVPGVGLAAAGWYVLAPRLDQVPLVGAAVLPGDLSLPAWLSIVTASAVAVLSMMLSVRLPRHQLGARPTSGIPRSPDRWRLLPLLGSTLLILFSVLASGESAVRFLLTGLLAAALSITFAMPVLIDALGRRIAGDTSVLMLLVGRRLSWNAMTSARPLMALAATAVLVPVGASYIAVARHGDSDPPASSVETLQLGGQLDAETSRTLEVNTGGVFVDVFIEEMGGDQPRRLTWVADCAKLGQIVQLIECGPERIVVEPAAAAAFAGLSGGTSRRPEGGTPAFRLLVARPGGHAENILRAFVDNSDQMGLSVTTLSDREPKESRLVPWIVAGLQLAAAGAFLALLMSVVTNASSAAGTRLRLVGVGAAPSVLRRLAAAESMILVAVVGLGGTVIGTAGAVAYAFVDGTVSPNYGPSLVLAGATVAAALAAGMAGASQVSTSAAETALRADD